MCGPPKSSEEVRKEQQQEMIRQQVNISTIASIAKYYN